MNSDNFYWLFSSSAQAIAAFIAFLLAGYTLVIQMLDRREERDDTLEPIHHELKLGHHRRFAVLSVLTGLAIVSSLAMLYYNGTELPKREVWAYATFVLNLLVVLFGISFVVRLVDPNRLRVVAQNLVKQTEQQQHPSGIAISRSEFFERFVALEKLIRDFFVHQRVRETKGLIPRLTYSFRAIVDDLYKTEFIPPNLYKELLEISNFRNAVFHGHVQNVDEVMLNKLRDVAKKVEVALSSQFSRPRTRKRSH